MPVLQPAVTEFDTGGGTAMTDFFPLLEAHYSGGGGTYFSYIGGGVSGSEAFALSCDLVVETFEMIVRRTSGTTCQISIDPIGGGNVTSAGNSTTPPTLTDATEWTGEIGAWELSGASLSTKFTLIEVPDALFIIHSDATLAFTPRGWHAGKVAVPFSVPTATTKRDGLGVFGTQPDWGSSTLDFWMNTSGGVSTTSLLRGDVSSWFDAQTLYENLGYGQINGNKILVPSIVACKNTDSTSDAGIYYAKYCLQAGRLNENQSPGVVLDGGVGNDGFVYVKPTGTTDNHVIPWDRSLTPHWG